MAIPSSTLLNKNSISSDFNSVRIKQNTKIKRKMNKHAKTKEQMFTYILRKLHKNIVFCRKKAAQLTSSRNKA